MDNSFGIEIRKIRINKGYSLRQVERQSGISNSFISEIENNRVSTPKPSTLKKLAHGLRVNYSSLLELAGITPQMPSNIFKPKGYVKLPVYGSIPCGPENSMLPETNDYKLVPADEDTQDMFFLRADGRSMEPKIMDKALVKIHLQHTIENKEIAAVSINDTDATLKQAVFKPNGQIDRFHPINPDFGDIYPDDNHRCRIIGKAVGVYNPL